jgi:hypothetical protein
MAKGEPTSGKILTPEMVRQAEQARQQTTAAQTTPPPPGGLITDPSQVSGTNLPGQLGKIILPGQE